MSDPTNSTGRGRWRASALFAAGVVMAVERFLTVEWTFPYCNDPQDGPASAVFGAPIPYERFSGFSLEYDFVPHFYVLNIIVLAGIALPVIHGTAAYLARGFSGGVYRLLAQCGLLLGAAVCARHALVLFLGLWHPVASIEHLPYDSYRELRPVRISLGRHYDCSRSTFWFGPKWRAP